MRRASGLQLLGLGLLVFLLVGGVASVIRNHVSTQGSVKSTIVSSSGENLAVLFEGLPKNPKYSLKAIMKVRRTQQRCGQKQEVGTLQRIYQRLFGTPVVLAKPILNCFQTACGGTGWVQETSSCNTGGSCRGTYLTVTFDGSSDDGFFSGTGHCGLSGACGCEEFTCIPD
jgi:hypothetical protein